MASFRVMGVGGLKLKDINPNKEISISKGWSIRGFNGGEHAIVVQGYKNIYLAPWSNMPSSSNCSLKFFDQDGIQIGSAITYTGTAQTFSSAISIPSNAVSLSFYHSGSDISNYIMWSLEA